MRGFCPPQVPSLAFTSPNLAGLSPCCASALQMDAERKDKEALEAKLLAMESKLLTSGGENVLDKVSGQNDLCVCVLHLGRSMGWVRLVGPHGVSNEWGQPPPHNPQCHCRLKQKGPQG